MSAAFAPPSSQASPEKSGVHRQIPSQRNREVFAAVVMGKSQEKVAQEFHLTQPRVAQIVEQVRDWTAQTLGGEDYGYTEVQQLRLAQATLQIQLHGWMRMAMQEWHATCAEKNGRTTFLGQASRLATQMARLAGVDVSGKTARMKAEQQALEEAQQRSAKAEKPLWKSGPEQAAEPWASSHVAAASSLPADSCACHFAQDLTGGSAKTDEKNSYEIAGSEPIGDPAAFLKNQRPQVPAEDFGDRVDKPIRKFLDKKVRKRLMALRRQEARAESLSAVG